MRVGEFTAHSKKADTAQTIQLQDVCLRGNKMSVTIRHAKNNQHNKPVTIEISGTSTDKAMSCPVKLMGDYLQVRSRTSVTSALFIHWDGSPLT